MNKILIFFLSFVFLVSCKNKDLSTGTVNGKMNSKLLQKSMTAADFDFKFFQGKAKVNFDDGKINQNFTANIRIQNNKFIWMSLTGPFGIEGARVMISKNRVQIIDRLNGKYYDEPFEFINNYLPFSADLMFVQNLIIGNSFQQDWGKQRVNVDGEDYKVNGEFEGIDANYTISPNFRYRNVQLEETVPVRKVNLDYADYKFVEDLLFAMTRNVAFEEGDQKVKVEMNFTKVKKANELDFPFEVPDRMKTNK